MAKLALTIVVLVTIVRVCYLLVTDYPLFFDEAQYWFWSTQLDVGYYSKPPMVAWLIALSTSFLGQEEWAIRLPSMLLHSITSFVIYATAVKLYDDKRIALWSCISFLCLPAVTLSSSLMSTDPVLLFFWALAFRVLLEALESNQTKDWLLTGILAGLGMLSKYTMVLFPCSVFLYLLFSASHRKMLCSYKPWVGLLAMIFVFLPNIIWNGSNGLVSFYHTKDNANMGADWGNWDEVGEFLSAQFGVFGPVLFGVLLWLIIRIKRTVHDERQKLLLCFILPMLGLITLISFISRAHANWAAPIYITATLLVVGWLIQTQKQWLLYGSTCLSVIIFGLFLGFKPMVDQGWIILSGKETKLSERVIKDPFKRLKGYRALGYRVDELLQQSPELVLLGDERKILAELVYYVNASRKFRHDFSFVKWNADGKVEDHYELITNANDYKQRDMLLITRYQSTQIYAPYFDHIALLDKIKLSIYADSSKVYYAYQMKGFKGY